jgi:hypothetical protein
MPKPRQVPVRIVPTRRHLWRNPPYFLEFSRICSGASRALSLLEIKRMKSQTLQYYMHDGPSAFRFELAGDLNNEAARDLDQAWRTASSMIGDRALVIDMTFVTGAEKEGRSLLARWYAEGAQLIARSKVSRALAEAIVGKPLPESASAGNGGARRTWLPFHISFGAHKLMLTLLIAALLLSLPAHAANLKAETVTAWDDYIQSVNVTLQDRVRPGGSFLWTYEDPERIAKVHGGEIVVAPAPGPSPRKVPGGLIHHWIAAAFLPNVKLDDILEVTEDYDRYQEFYRPSVIASKTIAREDSNDYFSMQLMNKAFFLKTMLDADYQSTNVRLEERRFYSVSRSTRLQEIQDYARPSQHRMPEGQGGGYIWKVFGIGRLAERDGGVYIELEAIALSRDIPAALRFIVDPIVRSVSRSALLTSLTQTENAVCGRSADVAKSASIPASAEHMGGVPASLSTANNAFTRVH